MGFKEQKTDKNYKRNGVPETPFLIINYLLSSIGLIT